MLSVGHVKAAFERLLNSYVDGFQADPRGFEDRLMDINISGDDPTELQEQLQGVLSDPENLLGALRSEAQTAVVPQLEALLAVVVGYVDFVVDKVGQGLLSSYTSLWKWFDVGVSLQVLGINSSRSCSGLKSHLNLLIAGRHLLPGWLRGQGSLLSRDFGRTPMPYRLRARSRHLVCG